MDRLVQEAIEKKEIDTYKIDVEIQGQKATFNIEAISIPQAEARLRNNMSIVGVKKCKCSECKCVKR
jgi:hypothetical protein